MTAILDRLNEYDDAVRRATGALADNEAKQGAATRALADAERELRDYQASGAPDESIESELVGRFAKLSNRRTKSPQGREVDAVLLGERQKLQRRLGEANAERDDFIRRHREAIIAAKLAEAYAAEAAQDAAAEAYRASTSAWTRVLESWRPLLEPLGLTGRDLPHTNPANEAIKMIAFQRANGATVPAPQSLVRQPEAIIIDRRTPAAVGAVGGD